MKIYLSPSNQPKNIYCTGSTNEKIQMEALANKIKTILDAGYNCETVISTISLDIGVEGRPREAKDKGCDVYLAIHSNAGGGTASGAVVYYHPDQVIGKTLATNIVKELNAVCPVRSNRSISTANGMDAFGGVGMGEVRTPCQTYGLVAVLAETDFHDNPLTAQWIINSKDSIAQAYVAAIAHTFNIIMKMKTSIMGKETITIEQCQQFLLRYNPNAPDIVPFYKKHGEILGIKWGYAIAQMIHETGYLKYGGDVLSSQNNYAGIGAVGGGVHGATFLTPSDGVLGHLQHLFAYASTNVLVGIKIDPRFDLVKRGSCPNWEDLNGHWAVPGIGYGEKIVGIYEKMVAEVTDEFKQAWDLGIRWGLIKPDGTADYPIRPVSRKELMVVLVRLVKHIQGGA